MNAVRRIAGMMIACLLGVLFGCNSAPHSAIVDEVKQAGAGDVDGATIDSLSTWFLARKNLTLDVANKCKALDPTKQPATWRQSTEGRVCDAAISTSWHFTPIQTNSPHNF